MAAYRFVATNIESGRPLRDVYVNHDQATCRARGFTNCNFGTLNHDARTETNGITIVQPGTTGNHWWTARYGGRTVTANGSVVMGGYEVAFDF